MFKKEVAGIITRENGLETQDFRHTEFVLEKGTEVVAAGAVAARCGRRSFVNAECVPICLSFLEKRNHTV